MDAKKKELAKLRFVIHSLAKWFQFQNQNQLAGSQQTRKIRWHKGHTNVTSRPACCGQERKSKRNAEKNAAKTTEQKGYAEYYDDTSPSDLE